MSAQQEEQKSRREGAPLPSPPPEAPRASLPPRPVVREKRLSPLLPASAPLYARAGRVVVRLVQGLHYHDALVAAPAMAFHFFLSLVPLLVFLGWVVGSLVRTKGAAAVLAPFFENVPQSSLLIIETELERLARSNASMAPLAVAGFLWLASSGVHGAMDTLEVVVGAPRRPYWKKRLLATGWVIASLAVVTVGSWGLLKADTWLYGDHGQVEAPPDPSGRRALRILDERREDAVGDQEVDVAAPAGETKTPRTLVNKSRAAADKFKRRSLRVLRSTGQRLLAVLVSAALTTAAFAFFYRFAVAHPREVRRRVWPGAVVAVLVWLVVSWAFGAYVTSLAEYAVFYGSLAAVAVLLVWFWLTSLAILVGAELNAQLEGMRESSE